jgi:DNA invertase Pin-like site-specific DNA recombinase
VSVRAVAYTRISNDPEGMALGVARQLEEIEALAARIGVDVSKHYEDNDRSAMSGVRPEFERMLAAAGRREFDMVLVWAPDRLYRRLSDLERLVDALGDIEVRTCMSGNVDFGSADGRMLARILGSVASREVERTQERLRAKHRELARAGKRAGGPTPYGWRTPEEGDVVRRLTRGLLAGESIAALRSALNREGVLAPAGGQWSHQGLRSVVLRPANAGLRRHQGQEYRAEWSALVTEDEFRAVEALLTDPSRRTHAASGRRHALSGVLRCGVEGCGLMLRHRASAGRRPSYMCDRGHLSIPAEPVEKFVLAVAQSWLDGQGGVHADISEEREALSAQRSALTMRLDEIAEGLADGTLDVKTAGAASERIRTQITQVEATLLELSRRSGAVEEGLIVADLSVERQRAVVGSIMKVTIKPVGRGGWRGPVEDRIVVDPA